MKAVHDVGFDVDKHELMKALAYDREQYKKGYADAMKNAVPLDKLCELMAETNVVIPCKICEYCDTDDCEIFPCPSTAEDWRNALTKWMEEQDAAN